MHISVIYGTLSVSCKRAVSVLSPLASNSCGRSQMVSFHTALPALLTGVLGDRRIRGDPEEMLIRNS